MAHVELRMATTLFSLGISARTRLGGATRPYSIAAEGFGYGAHDAESDTDSSGALPTFPTYTMRIGVADTVDIGARFANMSSLGVDVKWNFLKSESFDMAIDPGLQGFYYSASSGGEDVSVGVIYLNAPLMFGINLGDSVSIVPTLGVSYGIATASVDGRDGRDSATGSTGIMLRPGLGFGLSCLGSLRAPSRAHVPEDTQGFRRRNVRKSWC